MRTFLIAVMAGSLLIVVGCGGDEASSAANGNNQSQSEQELMNTLNGDNTQPAAAAGTTSQEVQQEIMTQSVHDTMQGEIRQVGSAPLVRTVLQPEDGEDALQLQGPQASELEQLVGARVRVSGMVEPGGMGQKMTVQQYQILSIGGQEPVVGELSQRRGGQYFITADSAGEELVGLSGVSEQLAQSVGQKVWVVVDDDGNVQRFGVLQTGG